MYNPVNNDKYNLQTWCSGDNNIKKQLDYVTISNKHKNWVINTRIKGTANVNNLYRRNITQMDLTMKLKKLITIIIMRNALIPI